MTNDNQIEQILKAINEQKIKKVIEGISDRETLYNAGFKSVESILDEHGYEVLTNKDVNYSGKYNYIHTEIKLKDGRVFNLNLDLSECKSTFYK